jgi:ubiquinol-cytochrome c reductase cytochrome b subunit
MMVIAVIMTLGGLVQVNPVWLYGPYDPTVVTSPAQPDWYLGWTEGALRLFPPWAITGPQHEVPAPFFPGVLLPGITFLLLYAWPFLEAWITGDHMAHNLLDRPRDRPVRSALGVSTLAFYAVLLGAGSNDLIAKWLLVDVHSVTITFRWLLLILPVLSGTLTYVLLRALVRSGADRLTEMPVGALWGNPRRRP